MFEQISSVKNEYIKQLSRLNTASGRRESGLFLVEGQKLCMEVIQSGFKIESMLITERAAESFDLSKFDGRILFISEPVAKKLSSMDTPPGIFAVAHQNDSIPADNPRFILALDHISDPSNLGAILRSAEAFGVDAIYLSDGCVDLYSPKVIRAAMGSAFRASVQKGNLPAYLKEQKKQGYHIMGAGLDRNFKLLGDISFSEPTIMIIGNEANGLTEEVMNCCDHGVFIPMLGKNESLNAAVAASIILWEQSKWK